MKRTVTVVLSMLLAAGAGEAGAAAKVGLVFDVQGGVEVQTPQGKTTRLEREKHILYPIKEGDRLRTRDNSRIVVVSLKDKTGYEVAAGSEAKAEGSKLKAVKGTVKEHRGYSVSTGGASGPIGALVLRGPADASAVKPVYPVDTAILDDAPELRWRVGCAGVKKVTVQVMEGENAVYTTEVEQGTVKIPAGVLEKGKKYSWKVDPGPGCRRGEADFSLPRAAEIASLREEMARLRSGAEDLPSRISYLFFLIDNNLREEARGELDKLQSEFPANRYLKEL